MHFFRYPFGSRSRRGTAGPQAARNRNHSPSFELLEPRYCLSASIPALDSLPGADHTIYLDFDGHVTEGTNWNSYWSNSSINSPAYDTNGDPANFSDAELAQIENIWRRVSEDFIPFQVNVTTVEPSLGALQKSGSGDSQWGVRAVITQDTVGCGCGGTAYLGSFNDSLDTPVFIFTTGEKTVAEATSHEVGHSLFLSHDGTSSAEYYTGHGSGETGWAPIMGIGYNQNVTQWDRGEYYDADEAGPAGNLGLGGDDLHVITTNNGFGYRSDDHRDTSKSAASLNSGGSDLNGSGIIETTTDVDVFSIDTAAGTITLNIDPASIGPNLDIQAELYDESGNLLSLANPADLLSATLKMPVVAGRYYLHVTGTGMGDPSTSPPTGYTDFASLGQYWISGTVGVVPDTDYLSITASDAAKIEGDSGATDFTFSVTRSGDLNFATSVDYFVTGSGSSPAGADDLAGGVLPAGNITFQAGQSSQVITVGVSGDLLVEQDEQFTVALAGATGFTQISVASAVGTILTDDLPPTLSVVATDANKEEGTSEASTPFTFTITRTGQTNGTSTVRYEVSGTGGKNAASAGDFEAGVYPSGIMSFAPGETSKTVVLSVVADADRERDERFQVTLSDPTDGEIATSNAEGTIYNDDAKTGGNSPSNGGKGNGRGGPKKIGLPGLAAEPTFDSLEYFGAPALFDHGSLSPPNQESWGAFGATERFEFDLAALAEAFTFSRHDRSWFSSDPAIADRVATDRLYNPDAADEQFPMTSGQTSRFSGNTGHEMQPHDSAEAVELVFEEGFDWLTSGREFD